MSERVIFLDIDGPIIAPKNLIAQSYIEEIDYKFHGMAAAFIKAAQNHVWVPDPVSVILITHLAQETDAKIVISSTWRGHGYKGFCEDFKSFGFDPALLHEDWRTTDHQYERREDEIQEWLDRHPETKSFVTIDDEPLDYEGHIQVCAANGFLHDNYNQAYEHLTGQEARLAVHMYNIAFVDYVGPQEIKDEDVSTRNTAERLAARKETIRKKLTL